MEKDNATRSAFEKLAIIERACVDILYRAVPVQREAINKESRTVELAFSSEEPVERWFGNEILDHSPSSVVLDRMADGGPVLVDHDARDHVGVVERVWIGSDRKGRALVRFGKSARAEEIFSDVQDGIRKNVSVGYRINEMTLEDPEKETYRATRWTPMEVSFVSIPADSSVGVRRNLKPIQEDIKMSTPDIAVPAAPQINVADIENRARNEQSARINDLLSTGDAYAKHGGRELASRAIKEGKDAKWLSDELMKAMTTSASPGAPDLGLNDKETRSYSVLRAIQALVSGTWEKAGFERECHQSLEKRIGTAKNGGFYVPYEVQKRDLTVGTANAGGYLVATDNLAGSFIDLLRARAKTVQLGANFMPGLQGNVTIPKLTGAATGYWLATEGTAITESQQTIGQLALSPKTLGAYTELSRLLMLQSNPAADNLVMSDFAKVMALAIDLAVINGSGAAGQPLGIIGTAGIGAVTGTSLNLAGIVEFETDVATANADVATLAYLTTPAVRGLLKSRDKTGTTVGNYVWGGTTMDNMLNGYRAEVSTQVPAANMLFGDFSQVVIAEWGTLEIALNPYAAFTSGVTGIRAFQTCDVGIRQATAFSLATTIT